MKKYNNITKSVKTGQKKAGKEEETKKEKSVSPNRGKEKIN